MIVFQDITFYIQTLKSIIFELLKVMSLIHKNVFQKLEIKKNIPLIITQLKKKEYLRTVITVKF